MDLTEYEVEWNLHKSTSSQAFQRLYEDVALTDVTLACEDNKAIRAHRVVLSSCSDFFRGILERTDSFGSMIYLQGISYKNLVLLKKFMYLGKASAQKNELKEFLLLSKTLLNQKNIEGVKGVNLTSLMHDNNIKNQENTECFEEKSISTKRPISLINDKVITKLKSTNDFFYTCTPCNFYTKLKSKAGLHKTENHKQTCDKCEFQCITKHEFIAHKNQNHANKTCAICDFKSNSLPDFREHHKKHRGEMFSCTKCSYQGVADHHSVSKHMKITHEGELPKKLRTRGRVHVCDQCGYKTNRKPIMNTHMERHLDTAKYVCEECGKTFKTKTMKQYHTRKMHSQLQLSCPHCPMKTTQTYNLKTHIRSVHEKIKLHCEFCNYSDATRSRLVLHIQKNHPSEDINS